MGVKEEVLVEVDRLNEDQIEKVAAFVKSLRFKGKKSPQKLNGNEDSLFKIGKHPIDVGITDSSEELDKYIY